MDGRRASPIERLALLWRALIAVPRRLAASLLEHMGATTFLVSGASMWPSLHDGDWLLSVSYRLLFREPRVGDVVVTRDPREGRRTILKRVAKELLGPSAATSGRSYYVLGDNPPASTDSRVFGPVTRQSIWARAVVRYWPPHRWGLIAPTMAEQEGPPA